MARDAAKRDFKTVRQEFFRTGGDDPHVFAVQCFSGGFSDLRHFVEPIEKKLHRPAHGVPVNGRGENDALMRQHFLDRLAETPGVIGKAVRGQNDQFGPAAKSKLHRPPGIAIGPCACEYDQGRRHGWASARGGRR